MKIKATHIIWGSIAILALSQGENVRHSLAKGNQVRQDQASFSDRIRANRTEARQAEKLSKVALDRYRNNCIFVVDERTGKESYFQPSQVVLDIQLNQPLRPNVPVCNKLGETAIVTQNGTLSDIARVSIPDHSTFKKLLEQRR